MNDVSETIRVIHDYFLSKGMTEEEWQLMMAEADMEIFLDQLRQEFPECLQKGSQKDATKANS